jgi:flagellar motility protein MotE (MotC chaperone)
MRPIPRGVRAGIATGVVIAALWGESWTAIALAESAAATAAEAKVAEAKKDEPPKNRDTRPAPGPDTQQYCANIAAATGSARSALQEKRLVELEQQISRRLMELEAKRTELQELLNRQEAFARKADESLTAIYARMRPDAAAAQLGDMEEESAAALLLRLQPKYASAILNEIEPPRAAALMKKISSVSTSARVGKKP